MINVVKKILNYRRYEFSLITIWFQVGLSEEDVDDMINAVDEDGNGEVSFDG